MSWPKVKLGDVAVVGSGSGFPTIYQGDSEGVYPFYKVSDMNIIGNEKYNFNDIETDIPAIIPGSTLKINHTDRNAKTPEPMMMLFPKPP